MKGKSILTWMAATALLLATMASLGVAQEPVPDSGARLEALMGTAFTYQGRLMLDEALVTATCDFTFRLYDVASGGTPLGTDTEPDVAVEEGLFTVALDFGAAAFNGLARWLEVEVDCGGGPEVLSPRQQLTPAPYALALPGLRTEQNDDSPNVIGGHSTGNSVNAGVVGATIGGGGYYTPTIDLGNSVTDDYGTVGGGAANTAGDNAGDTDDRPYTTVSGGYRNRAEGSSATVGGGWQNVCLGDYCSIGGGSGNYAVGDWAWVGGGYGNLAEGPEAAIGGGYGNYIVGLDATIGGGVNNTIEGSFSTIGGGSVNRVFSENATIGGGWENEASGTYATIPGGKDALAAQYGQMAHASGDFAQVGDAQTSVYVLRNQTSNETPTPLYLDGSGERLTVAEDQAMAFDILVIGLSGSGLTGGYEIRGVIENVLGTTAIVGTPAVSILGADNLSWSVSATADDGFDALIISVTGQNGQTIRWVATVRTAEVTW